jgi:hypothetical protein
MSQVVCARAGAAVSNAAKLALMIRMVVSLFFFAPAPRRGPRDAIRA